MIFLLNQETFLKALYCSLLRKFNVKGMLQNMMMVFGMSTSFLLDYRVSCFRFDVI
jgi:hypothetical protein